MYYFDCYINSVRIKRIFLDQKNEKFIIDYLGRKNVNIYEKKNDESYLKLVSKNLIGLVTLRAIYQNSTNTSVSDINNDGNEITFDELKNLDGNVQSEYADSFELKNETPKEDDSTKSKPEMTFWEELQAMPYTKPTPEESSRITFRSFKKPSNK